MGYEYSGKNGNYGSKDSGIGMSIKATTGLTVGELFSVIVGGIVGLIQGIITLIMVSSSKNKNIYTKRSQTMKKLITTVILLAGIALNVFAQQEIPMFFDSELGLQTYDSLVFSGQVTYSPNGNTIAISFGNGKIAIFDSTTGREITRITS